MAGMRMPVGPGIPGFGENDFGMTTAFINGHSTSFTYAHGFYCDKNVSATSTSKCEVGAVAKRKPGGSLDPLFITVPLGFTPARMPDCPVNLTCVDHPLTVDLTRLEKALKPLYPGLTDAQLTVALRDVPTPQHDHFITTANGGVREWWDVRVIGVTDKATYQAIHSHQSYAYIQQLIRAKNKHVLGPIPTNIFLNFSVQR
jgi:hypothetical protein